MYGKENSLVFEEPNLHNVIGSKRMEIFNEVRDKYKEIVLFLQ